MGRFREFYWSKALSIGKHPRRPITHYGNPVGKDENSSQLIGVMYRNTSKLHFIEKIS